MQRQLTELKKEKALMQQQIMQASQKIAQLEEQVGLWFYSTVNSVFNHSLMQT